MYVHVDEQGIINDQSADVDVYSHRELSDDENSAIVLVSNIMCSSDNLCHN